SSASSRRPTNTTVQPASAKASAAARPTPLPAPVTSAILLVSAMGMLRSLRRAACHGAADRATSLFGMAGISIPSLGGGMRQGEARLVLGDHERLDPRQDLG